MSYIKDNFLLKTPSAVKLYFDYAKEMPIFDYHCHLPEQQILENKPFENIYDVWLGKDHYKWRLMRSFGISEEYITGNKSPKEKFLMYCKALGTAFGNPLYHWSQLELENYFNCHLPICEDNAEKIWEKCNAYIKKNNLTPQKLIENSGVKYIFTTNEIFDDLSTFSKIKEKGYKFEVRPAFRADKLMAINAFDYLDNLNKLGDIHSLKELLNKIEERLLDFIKVGTVASDIAVEKVLPIPTLQEAEEVFNKRLNKQELDEKSIDIFKGYLTYYLLKLYGKYNIRSELHIGAMRNNNTKMYNLLGADTGYDSVAEATCIKELSQLMNSLNQENSLPPMIIFNLNPKMNSEIITLIGAFQDDSMKGKIQFGAAWWFLDNKVNIVNHLKDLSSLGHLATFIGMLTDSRSFLSYQRHQYFRRILCNYLGELMDEGEIIQDISFVGGVVKDICFNNAVKYFGL